MRGDLPATPLPLHCTAFGWVHLAWSPPRRRSLLVTDPLEAVTPTTVRTRQALETQLEQVVEHGFAVEWGHGDSRLATVAAPVFSYSKVALGIGVVMPRASLSRARAQRVGRLLRQAAERAAADLGVPPHRPPYTSAWSLRDPAHGARP